MVAPFLGCLAGGCLYDLFIFTGDSPVHKVEATEEVVAHGDV